MSTIPDTFVLLTKGLHVIGRFTSYNSIMIELDMSITDDGEIYVLGEKVNPRYIMSQYTKDEAMKDWIRCYMYTRLPKGYAAYRCLTNP